jgi:hypothetical protein
MVVIRVALVLSVMAGTALADGRGADLAALLDRMPAASVFGGDNPAQLTFGDAVVARTWLDRLRPQDQPDMADFIRSQFVLPLAMRDALRAPEVDWAPLVGFRHGDILQALAMADVPREVWLLQLGSGQGAAVPGTMLANGYAEELLAGLSVLTRGTEDFAIDVDQRNPDDPFGGMMGLSNRVWLDGDLLVRATGRDDLSAVISGDLSMLDRADVAALVAALDHEGAGEGALIRAEFLLDPSALLPRVFPPVDASQDQISAMMALTADYQFPGWGVGLIADLVGPDQVTALLVLTFVSSDQARTAADQMATRWQTVWSLQVQDSFAGISGQSPTITVADTSPPTVILRLTGAPDLDGFAPRNPGYDLLIRSWFSSDMVFLPAG